MRKGRLIWQWTRTHEVRVRMEPCTQCGEEITFGTYRREVWLYPSRRYGYEFVIERFHDDPVCPKYQEWER